MLDTYIKIKQEVKNILSHDKSWHWYDHTLRVYDLATRFCRLENADEEIVSLASLLHDVDDYKIVWKEHSKSLTTAQSIMNKYSIPNEIKASVIDSIQSIGYKKRLNNISPQTLEGKVISDADMCDAMGANGIIRNIVYVVSEKGSGRIFDPNIFPIRNISHEQYDKHGTTHDTDNAINHFFEKTLRLKNLMITDAGKQEAEKRYQVMVLFLREYFREGDLNDWSEFLEHFLEENKTKSPF